MMTTSPSPQKKTEKTIRKWSLFPKTVAESVGKITQPVFKKQGLETALIKHWREIVGSDLAAVCHPVKLQAKSKVLQVQILSSHALLAQHMQAVMLEKIAVYSGARIAERIQFQQISSMPNMPALPPEISAEKKQMAAQMRALREQLARDS